ncbi:MAG: hypothetical protein ACK559_00720 [bacterium]
MEWVGETGLAANLWREEMVRLDFQAESNTVSPTDAKTTNATKAAQQDWVINIQPMEIRTFVMKVIFD